VRNCACKMVEDDCIFLSADLDTFPLMVRLDSDTERRAGARRTTEYVHDTEIIFIMPSLQMHLKTEHLQGESEPQDDGMGMLVINF